MARMTYASTLCRATGIIFCVLYVCMKISPAATQVPLLPSPPAAAAPAPVAVQPPVTGPGQLQPQPQVINMIEALRDAGQFRSMSGLLDGLQMKSLTPMTTWLVPTDEAFTGSNYPRNVTRFLDYHVIRELLPFSRLLTLRVGTRIPTFLGAETCIVTNNHQFNFSIDNAMVVVPDLYSDSTVAVHGINGILDDASFNGVAIVSSPTQAPLLPASSPPQGSPSPSIPLGPLLNITFSAAYPVFATTGASVTMAGLSASLLALIA